MLHPIIKDLNKEQIGQIIKEHEVRNQNLDYFLLGLKDFTTFLSAFKNHDELKIIPIEIFIWGYGNDPKSIESEYKSIEAFYFIPRDNQMKPSSTVKQHLIQLSNIVIIKYFQYLNAPQHQKMSIQRHIKYILDHQTTFDFDLAHLLNDFYGIYNVSAIISQCCGIVLYGSNLLIKLTFIDFMKRRLGETTNDLIFTSKKKGIHFGIIARNDSNVYYVKFHHNYPICRAYDNPACSIDDCSSSTSSTNITVSNIPECSFKAPKDLDLKELFVYNLLARLSYGPKVNFYQRKDIQSYTLIITKGEEIIQFDDPSLNYQELQEISMLNRIPANNGVEKFIFNLTCFDIIARCMNLTDLHAGNLGLLKSNQGTSIEMYTPFVVDFSIAKLEENNKEFIVLQDDQEYFEIMRNDDYKYVNFVIYNDFIAVNSSIKYSDKLSQIFKPISFREPQSYELFKLFRAKKKEYGMIAFDLLYKMDFLTILESEYASFLHEDIYINAQSSSQLDLLQYKKSIIWNFKHLKKLLIINHYISIFKK